MNVAEQHRKQLELMKRLRKGQLTLNRLPHPFFLGTLGTIGKLVSGEIEAGNEVVMISDDGFDREGTHYRYKDIQFIILKYIVQDIVVNNGKVVEIMLKGRGGNNVFREGKPVVVRKI